MHATTVITNGSGEIMTEREAVAWDCAIACLASSVKVRVHADLLFTCLMLHQQFHRDFLEPLFPVVSSEYLLVAPHVMSHQDLEVCRSIQD